MSETDPLQILQHPDISGELKSAAFTLLRRICGAFGRLPRSYLIKEDFKTEQEIPFATRGYTDLWKRDWKGRKVAVKALRFGPDDDRNKTTKVMSRYLPIWISRDLPSPVEILQGGVIMETFESPEYSPVSRSLDEPEPVLYGFSMDGERQCPRLYEKEPGG